MPEAHKTNKRRYTRVLHDSQAWIISPSQEWQSRVIDISLNGALLERPAGWLSSLGARFALRIELEGTDEPLVLNMEVAVVAHIETSYIGFKCLNIDIDSISHLKRLMELNLGDAAMLQRELETLLETHIAQPHTD